MQPRSQGLSSGVKMRDPGNEVELHDALGQQQLELSTHTWSGRAPLKRRQICTPADVKQIIFICVLFYFELGGITKHLMTGPSGNSEFIFPSTSMFPSASPRGTLRVSGKQNSLFPLGPVIKCLLWKHSAAPRESTTFWPLWRRISLSIRVQTTLNHFRFVNFNFTSSASSVWFWQRLNCRIPCHLEAMP